MADTPFPVNPELTAVAIQYRNQSVSLIADEVLPRLPPLGVKPFKWLSYNLADAFTVPSTLVGRRGQPNEIEIPAAENDSSCLDYGLDDVVPQDDIEQAANAPSYGGFAVDPLMTATQYLTDLVLLDREQRVASAVFAAGAYAGNVNNLSTGGEYQWSDFVDSDPIADIITGMDACIGQRPNTLVFGQQSWSVFPRNPKVMTAINRTGTGATGVATRQEVCDLFEVQKILVGASFINTAKKGQAAVLARAWGKHAAALFINPIANNRAGITFGFTAQYGTRIAGSLPEPKVGLRGGQRVRVGESVREIIAAPLTSYFFQNAVA
jgi:hypothetical protein